MERIAYVGLDLHKKTVAWCAKDARGRVLGEGTIGANRRELEAWRLAQRRPWIGAMEATLFTGWVYDFLAPHARELKVAHPLRVRAIATAKKKNDRVDAATLADLLRCDLLPVCHIDTPQIRELRRVLRYRRLAVEQMVRMKNKTAGLLMEMGIEYHKTKLSGERYFAELMQRLDADPDVPPSLTELMRLSREAMKMFRQTSRRLTQGLLEHPALARRVEMLMTIPGVGQVTALTWALEIGDPRRFASIARAISYCGLCAAQRESAGKERRGPISKQRNRHLQTVLVEAAKVAPRYHPELAQWHARELARGGRNRATLAVARRLVARLMAVDRRATPFEPRGDDAHATRNKHEFCGHTMTRGKAPGAAKRRAPDAPSHGADVALQQSAAAESLQRGATRGKIKRAGARRKTA